MNSPNERELERRLAKLRGDVDVIRTILSGGNVLVAATCSRLLIGILYALTVVMVPIHDLLGCSWTVATAPFAAILAGMGVAVWWVDRLERVDVANTLNTAIACAGALPVVIATANCAVELPAMIYAVSGLGTGFGVGVVYGLINRMLTDRYDNDIGHAIANCLHVTIGGATFIAAPVMTMIFAGDGLVNLLVIIAVTMAMFLLMIAALLWPHDASLRIITCSMSKVNDPPKRLGVVGLVGMVIAVNVIFAGPWLIDQREAVSVGVAMLIGALAMINVAGRLVAQVMRWSLTELQMNALATTALVIGVMMTSGGMVYHGLMLVFLAYGIFMVVLHGGDREVICHGVVGRRALVMGLTAAVAVIAYALMVDAMLF